tara:strand:+ start:2871 stop:3101 length:231 start_codon:yes stop_codon:yes gene_type:complete
MSKKETYESVADSGIGWIDFIFDKIVDILVFLGNFTGLGYTVINVLIITLIIITVFLSLFLNLYLYKKLKNRNILK